MKRALMAAVIVLAGARPAAAEMPNYDAEAYCQHLGETVGDSEEMRHLCLDQEQAAYDQLKPGWDGLPQSVRAYCDNLSRETGQSYEMLKLCVAQEGKAAKANQQFKFQR